MPEIQALTLHHCVYIVNVCVYVRMYKLNAVSLGIWICVQNQNLLLLY